MVNAIQRQAAVVVKKSLQEGFGLGVTEAMWKARPVVASAVGGHLEQVQHRHSGLLVADPADVGTFGDAIVGLLQDPPRAARLGQSARERVRALFLNDRHFVRWVEVFGSALERRAGAPGQSAPRRACQRTRRMVPQRALDPGDRDALTGLWNRRRFEQELDRARENAEHLALLSIDVDRYNEVIQRHGPAAAQGLIQTIAHVLAERLRPNDTLARMGGDEFTAVFHPRRPRSSRAWPTGSARPCASSHRPPAPTGFLPPSALAPRSSTRARRRTTKRGSPPTPPCTRPRSQAATAPSCTSPRKTPSAAPQRPSGAYLQALGHRVQPAAAPKPPGEDRALTFADQGAEQLGVAQNAHRRRTARGSGHARPAPTAPPGPDRRAGARAADPNPARSAESGSRIPAPAAIWSMIPPTAEPMTGRPFHIPSATVRELFRQALLGDDLSDRLRPPGRRSHP